MVGVISGQRKIFVRSVIEIGIFSAAANLLLLVPPLYLLQIYDRVLASNSMGTLVYLSLFSVGALLVLGILEVARSLYSSRVATRLAAALGPPAFLTSMNGSRAGLGDVQPLRDLASVRAFIASRALSFLFDLPFGPLFILLLYFIHPLLFQVTLAGAVLMVAIAVLNQIATSRSDRASADAFGAATNSAQSFARNFETVRALGMIGNVIELWGARYAESLRAMDRVAGINAIFSGLSRTIRMVLQLLILGAGAYLVLGNQITAGMIFASAIISGRALQPLDQIIGSWQQIVEACRAWKRLSAAGVGDNAAAEMDIALPAPAGRLAVENLVYFPPGGDMKGEPLIKRLSFVVEPGESVALIGPSRAGKSTLARLIVGAIRQHSGVIRIDGADLRNWDSDALGRHVGYLSQDVELFPGTIAENISRFDPAAMDEGIVEAARMAQVHDLVLSQTLGYATPIGPGAVRLSGGERQRIGLARALHGDPRLIVLDEPNANLDSEGEAALERAIQLAKDRMATVLIITHRPSIAAKCDRVLMLRDGRIELFGPAADVLKRLQQGTVPPPAQPAPNPAPRPEENDRGNASGSFSSVIRVGG